MSKSSAPLAEISPDEAGKAGLPRASVSLAQTPLPLIARKLPFPGAYISASGPPGGILSVTVLADAASAAVVEKSLSGHSDIKIGTVNWNGQSVPSIASRHGAGHTSSQDLRVLAGVAGGRGIWILISTAPGKESLGPAEIARQSPYAELLSAVQIHTGN